MPLDTGNFIYVIYMWQSISRSCKNLKLCASLHVAKAPMLFSLLSKSYDPVFLLKLVFPLFCHSPSPCWAVQKITREGGANPCLHWKELLCGPFGEALDWSRGKRSRTVKETYGNKRLFWCEEKSVSSAPQADVATGLTGRPGPSWRQVQFAVGADTQFVHCLPRVGGAGWRRGRRAGWQVSQPDCSRIQKYLGGKKLHFNSF